jgi:hypothetical protein
MARSAARSASTALEEVTDEEVHLEHQLLDVEGQPEGLELRIEQLGAALLQADQMIDGLLVERQVPVVGPGARVGLQRHVAEIVEDQDAQVRQFAAYGRDGQRDGLEQLGDPREEERTGLERCRMERDDYAIA